MTRLVAIARKFAVEIEGASMVEYGLMIALVTVLILGLITAVGTGISNTFSKTNSALSGNSISAASGERRPVLGLAATNTGPFLTPDDVRGRHPVFPSPLLTTGRRPGPLAPSRATITAATPRTARETSPEARIHPVS